MKNLKPLFIVAFFSIVISSCTPQTIEENPSNSINNIQASGNETDDPDNGTKD